VAPSRGGEDRARQGVGRRRTPLEDEVLAQGIPTVAWPPEGKDVERSTMAGKEASMRVEKALSGPTSAGPWAGGYGWGPRFMLPALPALLP
jgi:hypothetical protein